MTPTYVWAAIVGMALCTFALRLLPIAGLSHVRIPSPVERWLSFVPVSVMASLVAGEVLRPNGAWMAPLTNPYLLAAIPTAIVYRLTRSLLGATIVGILAFLAFRALLG